MTGNLKRLRPYDRPPKSRSALLPSRRRRAAMGYFGFGAFWLLTATGLGTFAALQLVLSEFEFVLGLPFGLTFELTPTTVAAGFRHTFVWGWLTNAALGAIFFITPRVTGRPICPSTDRVLGMVIWNVGFAAGLTLLYIPQLADTGTLTGFPLVGEPRPHPGPGPDQRLVLAHARRLGSAVRGPGLVRGGDVRPAGMTIEAAVVGALDLDPTVDAIAEAMWAAASPCSGCWASRSGRSTTSSRGSPASRSPLARSAGSGSASWAVLGVVVLRCGRPSIGPVRPGQLPATRPPSCCSCRSPPIIGNLAMTFRGRWSLALSPGPAALAVASLVFLGGSVLLLGIGSLREVQEAVARTEWPFGVAAFGLGGAATIGLLAVGSTPGRGCSIARTAAGWWRTS